MAAPGQERSSGTRPGVAAPSDVTAGRQALGLLVGDVDAFLAGCWGREPLLRHGQPGDRLTGLLTLRDVDALLTGGGLRLPAVRVVRAGNPAPPGELTAAATAGGRRLDDVVDPGRVAAHFRDGATVNLQGVHRYWPPLREFCRRLEVFLSHPVQVNAYLSPAQAQGLRVHHDTHDVFVVQVHGVKRFDVYEPQHRLPLADQRWTSDTPPGPPLIEAELKPGDCLYMPRGYPHRAYTTSATSLHLTIGVPPTTWLALVKAAAEELADVEELREALPVGYAADPGTLRDQLAARLEVAALRLQGADVDRLAHSAVRRFVASRPPDLRGTFEAAAETPTGRAAPERSLRRRPGTVAALVRRGERVDLVLGDRTLGFPADVEPALAEVLGRDSVGDADLAHLLDPSGRQVLLRRLAEEGLLEATGRDDQPR